MPSTGRCSPALVTAGERLKSEPGVRAVVLSGEGPDFCAGLDFGSFAAMRDGERLSALVGRRRLRERLGQQ